MTHSPRGISLGTGTGLDGTTILNRATCTVTPEPTASNTILIIRLSVTNAAVHPMTPHNMLMDQIFAFRDIALPSR